MNADINFDRVEKRAKAIGVDSINYNDCLEVYGITLYHDLARDSTFFQILQIVLEELALCTPDLVIEVPIG